MIRNFLFCLLFLVPTFAVAAANTPTNLIDSTAGEILTRFFYSNKEWSLLAEANATNESDNRNYRKVLLGGYFQINDNLRTGVFYQRQYGVRHDEDWFKDPVTGWQWADTNQRAEDLAVLDVSPKALLSFFSMENWTFEFKTRYEYNFFNQTQTLRLRPNLSYFWLRDGVPTYSLFLQFEQALALNYGAKQVVERWTYFGLLHHYDSSVQFGVFVAQKWVEWVSTTSFTALTSQKYEVSANSNVLGLLFIYKL